MYKTFKIAGLVVLLCVLADCAGKNFVRPSSDAFQLGRTKYSQVIQQMGKPRKVADILKNEKPVKSITYVYASQMGEPLEKGVIPVRALVYFFHNDTLVGQDFVSSFKSDNSNFDNTKVENIKRGQTTRAEVIQMLGNPTASFIPPMVKATSDEAIGYSYTTTRKGVFGGIKNFSKNLRISFDEKDLVSDVEYTSKKTK